MNIRLANNKDKDLWNEFVFRHSDSPFHLYEWKELFETVYGYECLYLMAEHEKEIVGILPLAIIRSWLFGYRACSMPFLDYGGPLFRLNKTDSVQCLKSFSSYLSSYMEKIDYLEVRSPPQKETLDTLNAVFTLGKVKYLCFLIDLNRPFDEIWKKEFDSDLRRKIKKASKNGIAIAEQSFEAGLDDFYHTYLLAMKKLGSPPHKFEFFSTLPKILGERRVKFFQIMKSGKHIGGALVFLGNSSMHYGYEVIDPEYKTMRPAYLLYSEMLRWGCEHNLNIFDTGRTMYGSGVYLFKKQWGGSERLLPYYYSGRRIPQEDPREKFSFLSELWGRLLPLSLTEKIGWRLKAGVGH